MELDLHFPKVDGQLTGISISCFLKLLGKSSLFLGLSQNSSFHDIASSQSLQLSLSTLDFDVLSKFFVTDFSGTSGFDMSNVNLSVESGFVLSKFRLCFCSLSISLGSVVTVSKLGL